MNWFQKTASPTMLNPFRDRDLTDTSNAPHIPIPTETMGKTEIKPVPINKRIQIFNYLKAQNVRVPMYHGTMLSRYLEAQKMGYLLSASNNKHLPNHLTPEADQKFVFLTGSKIYARSYCSLGTLGIRKKKDILLSFGFDVDKFELGNHLERKRYIEVLEKAIADVKTDPKKYEDDGVIITIDMPLYAITEVRDAILGGMSPRTIGDTIKIPAYMFNTDRGVELIKFIKNEIQKSAAILTCYTGVPLKWTSAAEKVHGNSNYSIVSSALHDMENSLEYLLTLK